MAASVHHTKVTPRAVRFLPWRCVCLIWICVPSIISISGLTRRSATDVGHDRISCGGQIGGLSPSPIAHFSTSTIARSSSGPTNQAISPGPPRSPHDRMAQ
ncbi:MAG: hypothetical protein IPH07_23860 [Deltaproteobacteria bacterium]|nr:hypothetical protein [Deltaproteobacteria bacterium]